MKSSKSFTGRGLKKKNTFGTYKRLCSMLESDSLHFKVTAKLSCLIPPQSGFLNFQV